MRTRRNGGCIAFAHQFALRISGAEYGSLTWRTVFLLARWYDRSVLKIRISKMNFLNGQYIVISTFLYSGQFSEVHLCKFQ